MIDEFSFFSNAFGSCIWSLGQGKYIPDANHSAVKLTTKRTPRQYMNRRGNPLFLNLQNFTQLIQCINYLKACQRENMC